MGAVGLSTPSDDRRFSASLASAASGAGGGLASPFSVVGGVLGGSLDARLYPSVAGTAEAVWESAARLLFLAVKVGTQLLLKRRLKQT